MSCSARKGGISSTPAGAEHAAATGIGDPRGRLQPRNNALGAKDPKAATCRRQNQAQSDSGTLNCPPATPTRAG